MGKRILIIEDDPSLVFLYQRALGRIGYEVRTAEDGAQALEMIERDPPDLLVVDVKLKGEMDGLEFLSKALVRRRIPSIINTAYASYRDSFLSWAADAYVLKSSDLTELAETMGKLLATEDPVMRRELLAAPLAAGTAI